MGRRIEKKVYFNNNLIRHVRFVYDGYLQIEELDALSGNTVTKRRVWGRGKIMADYHNQNGTFTAYYALTDANKNITEYIDATGNIAGHYEYSPFGRITASTGTIPSDFDFRFSSEYYDPETHLVYYNYRYYSPELGRWLSRDPIGEFGHCRLKFSKNPNNGYISQKNELYTYTNNSPINTIDKKGESALGIATIAVIAAAAACLYPHFRIGLNSYPNNEVMRHCWTSCAAARTCGMQLSAISGLSFEVITEGLREIYGKADWINSIKDIINNAKGLSCAGYESAVGLGNLTRWFRESCECCCKRRTKH